MKTSLTLSSLASILAIASTAHAETGFLQCKSAGPGCTLVREEVANSTPLLDAPEFQGTPLYNQSYDATYEADVHFDCPPFKTASSIHLVASPTSSEQLIIQPRAQHVTLRGTGPLRLKDSNPAKTYQLYDVFLKCNIHVNVTSMRPSVGQSTLWLDEGAALVRDLDADANFYPQRWDLETWYGIYVGDPAGAGILRDLVATLKASASEQDRALAENLQKILDGFPLDALLVPYLAAKARLEANLDRALLVKTKLAFAQRTNELNMDAARERALLALTHP